MTSKWLEVFLSIHNLATENLKNVIFNNKRDTQWTSNVKVSK